jgi:hypothetical protein
MTSPLWVEEQDSYRRGDGIELFARRAFCRDYFNYKPGQHVVFGGPSQHGKTTLAFDCLEYCATPEFPAYLAVSKPQDPVMSRRGNQLGFRRVSDWPPPKKIGEIFGGKKPPGFVVWPQFGDLNTDMERCAAITSKLLMERYAHGASGKNTGGILVMDDTMVKAKIMGLDKEMVTILAMAGAMDLGLGVFVQKPTDSGRTPLWGFEQSQHMFLTKGGDDKMLSRYAEIIGGQNGVVAKRVIPTLKTYEFLYVNKDEDTMCIVGSK